LEFLQLIREARREATAEPRRDLRQPLVHTLSLGWISLLMPLYALADQLIDGAAVIAAAMM
jgi:hypothetical protein